MIHLLVDASRTDMMVLPDDKAVKTLKDIPYLLNTPLGWYLIRKYHVKRIPDINYRYRVSVPDSDLLIKKVALLKGIDRFLRHGPREDFNGNHAEPDETRSEFLILAGQEIILEQKPNAIDRVITVYTTALRNIQHLRNHNVLNKQINGYSLTITPTDTKNKTSFTGDLKMESGHLNLDFSEVTITYKSIFGMESVLEETVGDIVYQYLFNVHQKGTMKIDGTILRPPKRRDVWETSSEVIDRIKEAIVRKMPLNVISALK
ncbi:MAG: hypothetical protein JRM72_01185 [Nitrososphaerota archaeon]|nr:hypothetical protein [Nitrososphaerota archaeon]